MVYRFFKLTSSHSCRFTSEATVSPLSSSKIEAAPKSTVFRQLLSRFSPLLFLVMPVSIVGTPQHNSKSYGNTTENNLQNKCFRSRQQTRRVTSVLTILKFQPLSQCYILMCQIKISPQNAKLTQEKLAKSIYICVHQSSVGHMHQALH